jgi:phosphoribulokinase
MVAGSFMSRPNTLVVPGGKMGFVMELILREQVERMLNR